MRWLTVLVAVSINVVAAEPNATTVTADELVEPTNWLTGGSVAEVLCVEVGAVAEAKNVLLCMLSELDGLV